MHFSIDRSPSWTSGGTGVTNFQAEDLDIYTVAITLYGCQHLFIGHPMPASNGRFYPSISQYALRDSHPNRTRDLSRFWAFFDYVKAVKRLTEVLN